MKSLKKLLLLSISSLAVASLTACGSGSGDEGESIDPTKKVKISIYMNDWEGFKNAVSSKSPIYSKISNDCKVEIDCKSITGEPWESISAMATTNTLPDMFITRGTEDPSFFKSLINGNKVIAISDYVTDANTYPNLYKHMRQFDFMKSNIEYAKGKTWFVPSSWHLEKSLYVRTDWIDNLNAKLAKILVADGVISSESQYDENTHAQYKFKVPETILDFYYLARGFTLHDPDNNGKKDTYGYTTESNKDMDAWAYVAYDAGWDQFVQEGNKYISSNVAPGAKKATALLTRMSCLGYTTPDSLNNTNDDKQKEFANGVAGMMYAHNWYNNIATYYINHFADSSDPADQKAKLADFRNNVALVNPPAGPDGTYGGAGQAGYWEGFCINAKLSNAKIKSILSFYDYLMSEKGYELLQYGVEGTHYTKETVDGKVKYTSLIPDENNGLKKSLVQVDQASYLSYLVDWTMSYNNEAVPNADKIVPAQENSGKHSGFEDYPCVVTRNYTNKYPNAKKSFQETLVDLEKSNNAYYVGGAETNFNKATDLKWEMFDGSVDSGFASKFNARWETHVENYQGSLGGQTMEDEYNQFIASGTAVKVDPAKTYWYRPNGEYPFK